MPNRATLRTAAFFACLTLWTVGLLVPIPKNTASAALGGESGMFFVGKMLHVTAYAFLTVLGGTMVLTRRQRWLLLGLVLFHTVAIEFLQRFVERGSRWEDVVLDLTGVVLGVAIAWRWWRALLPEEARGST